MAIERVYTLPEVARLEGLTIAGAAYWLSRYGLDHCQTATHRILFTALQLENFRRFRAEQLSKSRRGNRSKRNEVAA